MSFDTTCRRLAEQFSTDFAQWLLGEAIAMTELSPTELSLEPIRADALILQQSEARVLHAEFQTDPDAEIPFRLLDYRVRVHRRFPAKAMHQVVIYLRRSRSPLVYQNCFSLERTRHEFDVIRLWEELPEKFLRSPGLLPFAVLAQTTEPDRVLQQAAQAITQIPNPPVQAELAAATFVLAGLVLEQEVIQKIIRRDVMQASVTYQAIKQEGHREGREEGQKDALQATALNMLREQLDPGLIARMTGLELALVHQLQQTLWENGQD